MPATREIVFTAAAAQRILGTEEPIKIQVWAFVVWTHVKGQRPTLISKTAFLVEFSRFRQEGAKQVVVRQMSFGYKDFECHTEGSDRIHSVKMLAGKLVCSCPDFEAQVNLNMPNPACRHSIATMNSLEALEEVIRSGSETRPTNPRYTAQQARVGRRVYTIE